MSRLRRIELGSGAQGRYSVPPVIQGCWQLAAGHGQRALDEEVLFRLLVERVSRGFDTFDCADIYTGVEELLGRARRRALRDLGPGTRFQIHTKVVPDIDRLASLDRCYVESLVDRSLTRLGVERLDLVQFHWWDYQVPRYVEVAGWLAELVAAGKVRALGLTNFDQQRTRELQTAGIPITSLQVQYSLLDRRPAASAGDRSLADACAQAGVGLLCYGTLAGGFLNERWLGRPEPGPGNLPNRSLVKYRLIIDEVGGWPALQKLLRALDAVATRHRSTIATVASRWVLDQPGVAAAIVGVGSGGGRRDPGDYDLEAISELRLDVEDRQQLASALQRTPPGNVYELERDREGRHGRIMKYQLNRGAEPVSAEKSQQSGTR